MPTMQHELLPPKLLWGRLVGVQEQAECISALFLWESGLLSTSYYAVALQLLWQPCRIHFSSVNHKPTKITDANIEKYDPIHVCYHVSKKKQRCMELGGQPPLPIFGPRTTRPIRMQALFCKARCRMHSLHWHGVSFNTWYVYWYYVISHYVTSYP